MSGKNVDPKGKKLTQKGFNKQARNATNILRHVTANDKESQAVLIANMVDQQGPGFAAEVKKNKKKTGRLKMSAFETASMTAGLGIPDNAAIKIRSAMNKNKGWNILASKEKVKKVRRTELPFGKGVWNFQKLMLYRNKEGKNKRTQKNMWQ